MTDRTIMQLAIDTVDPAEARRLALAGVSAGAQWLEIGKPFIEFNGLRGCADLVAVAPEAYWLADLMIMAGAPRYIEAAADLGIRNVTVTGLAPRSTVRDAVVTARAAGLDVTVDLFHVTEPVNLAREAAGWGATHMMVHVGGDQKRLDGVTTTLSLLREVVAAVSVPVSYAAYDIEEAQAAVAAGAAIIVQGEPLISQPEAAAELRRYREQLDQLSLLTDRSNA